MSLSSTSTSESMHLLLNMTCIGTSDLVFALTRSSGISNQVLSSQILNTFEYHMFLFYIIVLKYYHIKKSSFKIIIALYLIRM